MCSAQIGFKINKQCTEAENFVFRLSKSHKNRKQEHLHLMQKTKLENKQRISNFPSIVFEFTFFSKAKLCFQILFDWWQHLQKNSGFGKCLFASYWKLIVIWQLWSNSIMKTSGWKHYLGNWGNVSGLCCYLRWKDEWSFTGKIEIAFQVFHLWIFVIILRFC